MADGFNNPFSSLIEQVNNLTAQKNSAQTAAIQLNLQERIAEQTRQGLANEYLSRADFTKNPAESLRTLGSILNNPDLVKASLDVQLKQSAFDLQRKQIEDELSRQQAEQGAKTAVGESLATGDQAGVLRNAPLAGVLGTSAVGNIADEKFKTPEQGILEQQKITAGKAGIEQTKAITEKIRLESQELRNKLASGVKEELSEDEKARLRKLGYSAAESEVKLEQLPTVKNDIEKILSEFDKIPTALRGPLSGRTLGLAGGITQLSESIKTYGDIKKLVLTGLARFTGQTGVLTDKDLLIVEQGLPEVIDKPEIAERKKTFLRNYLQARFEQEKNIATLPERQRQEKRQYAIANLPAELRKSAKALGLDLNPKVVAKSQSPAGSNKTVVSTPQGDFSDSDIDSILDGINQ